MSKNYIWGVVIVVIIIILAIIWGVNRDTTGVDVTVPTTTDDMVDVGTTTTGMPTSTGTTTTGTTSTSTL
jgi:hypothetical protein